MKDSDSFDADFIRDYPVAPDRLWQAVTQPDQLMQWFGPEGVRQVDCAMDFTAPGPWHCVMEGRESGDRFHVSGQVTSVQPPREGAGRVSFTWAWHDGSGARGAESFVTFEVTRTDTGARLTLTHRGLTTLEAAQSHSRGWTSTLLCLDRHLA
ncbi:SRPBCC family protein [Pseudooceanicola aestuarii]|uniref:SRPBCC family protein n=1 Tax=Pseudooceanicola aestuarii TaxID=2697319 RepID=UPI0013D7B393|nr:SRPBCC domain-containing protein [Pseudooceanicola aestuarii]